VSLPQRALAEDSHYCHRPMTLDSDDFAFPSDLPRIGPEKDMLPLGP
jgi:hypothetical protein